MSWLTNASANLLPLSQSSDYRTALSEWNYTGEVEDTLAGESTCDLCDHPNIRYKFEIENRFNNNVLYIGSECICKFGILGIDENGDIISHDQTVSQIHRDRRRFIQNKKDLDVLNALVQLTQANDAMISDVSDFYQYYNQRKAFTPKQLSLVIWRLEINRITFRKSSFRMIIRRNREKDQFIGLDLVQVNSIWDCISSSQRDFYLHFGKHRKLKQP
jgi:hypothetical protein